VLVEQWQFQVDTQGGLLREIVERIFAHAVISPGVARREVHLGPALRNLVLQADLAEVVLSERANDLGASDQCRDAPVA
jgi:hypothetical protein